MSQQNVSNEVNEEYVFFHNYGRGGEEDANDENELLTIQTMSKELRREAREKIKLGEIKMRDASNVKQMAEALKVVFALKIVRTLREPRTSISRERRRETKLKNLSICRYTLNMMELDKMFDLCEEEIQQQKCIKKQLESCCKRGKFQLYRAAMRVEGNTKTRAKPLRESFVVR